MATAQNKLGGGRLARHVLPNSWQVADTPNQLVDCQVHVFSHNESKELKVVSHDVPQCFGGSHLLFLSLRAQLSILSKLLLCVAAATPGGGRVTRVVAGRLIRRMNGALIPSTGLGSVPVTGSRSNSFKLPRRCFFCKMPPCQGIGILWNVE